MDSRSVRTKRSVRHAQASAARQVRAPSRRHLTRLERERRTRLAILAGGILIVLIAIAIPAYGYYREVIRVGDTPVAVINGQSYTLEQYARYAGAMQGILARQITRTQPLAPPPGTAPDAKLTPEQQKAQSTLQSLQAQQAGLSTNGLTDFIESKLVIDEGKTRGLTVSPSELSDAQRWLLSPPDAASSPGSGLQALPDKLPTTGLVSTDDAQKDLTQIAANNRFLTLDQINEQIVKPAVLKARLVSALSTGPVQTTQAQIHARHILVATEQEALTIRKQLDSGGDFAALAAQYSTDTSNKDKGGDLGWFGKGQMVPEFEQAAFALKPGEISQPVKTSFGYHLIQVLESDPNRALDPTRIDQLRQAGYQSWLGKVQNDPQKVSYGPGSSKTDWVHTYITSPG